MKAGDKLSIVQFSDYTKILIPPAFFNKDGLVILSIGLSLMKNEGLYTDLYEAIKNGKPKTITDEQILCQIEILENGIKGLK